MVMGEWIVFTREMRCKNWVNGIEVNFCVNEANRVEGKISYIPPEIIEGMPATINLAIFLFRMWRQATIAFERDYYRKKPRH
jgi:hypothetical protein